MARDLYEIVISMICVREGSGMVPELWCKPFVGKGLVLAGPVGWCASTHSFHALERPGVVWAARRALFIPHLMAADYEVGSGGSHSPDLGDMWRYGYPKSPDWDGNVGSWTESEGTSSSEQCEHNVGSFALNVMVQDQSGEMMSFFLEDWELARVALSCHIALDMLCQEMHEAW